MNADDCIVYAFDVHDNTLESIVDAIDNCPFGTQVRGFNGEIYFTNPFAFPQDGRTVQRIAGSRFVTCRFDSTAGNRVDVLCIFTMAGRVIMGTSVPAIARYAAFAIEMLSGRKLYNPDPAGGSIALPSRMDGRYLPIQPPPANPVLSHAPDAANPVTSADEPPAGQPAMQRLASLVGVGLRTLKARPVVAAALSICAVAVVSAAAVGWRISGQTPIVLTPEIRVSSPKVAVPDLADKPPALMLGNGKPADDQLSAMLSKSGITLPPPVVVPPAPRHFARRATVPAVNKAQSIAAPAPKPVKPAEGGVVYTAQAIAASDDPASGPASPATTSPSPFGPTPKASKQPGGGH